MCRYRSYDFRGDGVAEDMILLTFCFNTFVPELPAVWCLENGKGVFRPTPKIEGPHKDLVQGVCIFAILPRIPLEASGKVWPRVASEELAY